MLNNLNQGSFSGHETFTFRYPWLKKGVDGLKKDPVIFQKEEAIVELGVGKNMVSSIRHWCLSMGMIEERDMTDGERRRSWEVSELGQRLLKDNGWDPYLEDDATLWLLHWLLVTNSAKATTWYVAFYGLRDAEFTRESLVDEIIRITEVKQWATVSRGTVENDVSCFIRTYISSKRGITSTLEDTLDCPLTHLGLLQADIEGKKYRFNTRSKPSLPIDIFAFALVDFWTKYKESSNTLSVKSIITDEGSPGRAFRLDEDTVLGYLDKLSDITNGAMKFEDTALIRQVVRVSAVKSLDILRAYYG
jgi:hypothetical protein